MKNIEDLASIDYMEARIQLLKLHKTFKSWAQERGYERSTVWKAVKYGHNGRLSILIRKTLRQELNLTQGEK